jgi:CDP-diacylglycerol--glycerol-3-phosphate 3-phosphatidyltransferase
MTTNITMTSKQTSIYNVPNALTSARFALAIAVMLLIPMQAYSAAVILFLIAASTDWMDGYWARKYGQVTKLGRIFDPFANQLGKWKMVVQCAAVVAILLGLIYPSLHWIAVTGQGLLWAAILITLYSGYVYVVAAAKLMRTAS